MLDENPDFHLNAPKPGDPKSTWFNITVEDIKETYEKAMNAGCVEIQPVTELPDYGVSNAMFADSFGYIWMLHQVHREVSLDERVRLWEEKKVISKRKITGTIGVNIQMFLSLFGVILSNI